MFDQLEKLSRLSDVFQFSTHPVIRRISVAEHSFYVALCALFIRKALKDTFHDSGDLLPKALLHDIEEYVISDIPYSVKNQIKGISSGGLKSIQHHVVAELFGREFLEFSSIWIKSKDGYDGQIVKLADRMALVLYLLREHNMGNKYTTEVLSKLHIIIEEENVGQFTYPIAVVVNDWIQDKLYPNRIKV